jgi:4-hydroxy-3-polyprenylbenzoate decarboxylase
VCVVAVEKTRPAREVFEALRTLSLHVKLLVFVDNESNDVNNPYMLVWRVVNNMDAKRDVFLEHGFLGIDGTNKTEIDGYLREWPKDTDCDIDVIATLQEKKLILVDKEFLKHYHV